MKDICIEIKFICHAKENHSIVSPLQYDITLICNVIKKSRIPVQLNFKLC